MTLRVVLSACAERGPDHSIIRISKVNPWAASGSQSGVVAASCGRIQFDFQLDGVRYRPTIKRPPSEANLRRARERLQVIKRQIEDGMFSVRRRVPGLPIPAAFKRRLQSSVVQRCLR